MRTDGSNDEKLLSNITTFNIKDKWVYYSVRDEGIFRAHLDGTGEERISRDVSSRLFVIDNWIYYYNSADRLSYRMHYDGTESKIVD
jgi:hypothetical protein